MNRTTSCAAVRAVSTLWLDRRVGATARAHVEAHLRACPECRAEYRDLARLGRAVAHLPRRAPSPMAARRALAVARGHVRPPAIRDFARGLTLQRAPFGRIAAAALLLFGAGLAGAYLLGLRQGRARATSDSAAPIAPVASVTPPPKPPDSPPPPAESPPTGSPATNVEPKLVERTPSAPPSGPPEADALSPTCARAAQSLLTDLATIDQVAPKLRQPLLGAQIRVFGLDAWAARPPRADDPDAALIALVRQLESALASKQDGSLLALQQSLHASPPRQIFAAPQAARGTASQVTRGAAPQPTRPEIPRVQVPRFTRAAADAVVRSYDELAPADRAPLTDLLEAKASWISGDVAAALERARSAGPKLGEGRLGTPYRTLIVLSAGEAGDRQMVEALQQEIDGALDEVLNDLLRRLRSGDGKPAGR
jgi:hypothetical protein